MNTLRSQPEPQPGRRISRRTLLRSSAGGVLGMGAWTAAGADRIHGANERVNVAIIGCGGRGRFVIRVMIEDAGANCVCLCDLSEERLNQAWEFISPVQSAKPRLEKDF